MKKLRVAIIGCGGIAQVHKASVLSLEEAELAGCCDIKPDRAEAMAKACGIPAFTDAETMMDTLRPDVVHICTPHPLHTPLAEKAVSRGIHVFTEKPPVVNAAQWAAFSALKNAPGRVGICFQNRYNESVKALRAAISAPDAGRILGARAFVTWDRPDTYYTESDWRGSWTTEGGGNLINQSIHTLDLLCFLFGTPVTAEATMRNHRHKSCIGVEDTVEAFITFRDDIQALFYSTNAHCANSPVMMEVTCENLTARMEGQELTLMKKGEAPVHTEYTGPEALGKDYWGNGHVTCIRDFYRSILEDRPYMNGIDSVADTMKLMLDLYAPYRGTKVN